MAPLLGAVPFFIPRDFHRRDEVITFNAVSAAVREHRLVQGGSIGVAHSALTFFGGQQCQGAALASEDQEALWFGPKDVLNGTIFGNHLPGNEPPRAN